MGFLWILDQGEHVLFIDAHKSHALLQGTKWRLGTLCAFKIRAKGRTKLLIGLCIVSSLRVHELPTLSDMSLILLYCYLEIVCNSLINWHNPGITEPEAFRWTIWGAVAWLCLIHRINLCWELLETAPIFCVLDWQLRDRAIWIPENAAIVVALRWEGMDLKYR